MNSHLKKRKICEECRAVFIPENPDQERCIRCHVNDKENETKETYNRMFYRLRECPECRSDFRAPESKKYCYNCFPSTSKEPLPEFKEKQKPKVDYKKQFLKEKKPRKGANPEMLNKKMEYKRVMDDKGWKHYLKGRKWDRI